MVHFFQFCWEIVQEDVFKAVEAFFREVKLTERMKRITIYLIPKVTEPKRLRDLPPISLTNVICRLVSKIITIRISTFVNDLILLEQGAFLKSRLIAENIALAQEMVQNMDKKVFGNNVVIKLDMEKAFDRVDWQFL